MRRVANTTELQDELRRLLADARSHQPSRARLASELRTLSRRVAASPDLETQFKEHSAHKPRISTEGDSFVVEAYSPVKRGYIPMAEWATREQADKDLRSWMEAWEQEQANFKAALK